jgi:hypothetical protein
MKTLLLLLLSTVAAAAGLQPANPQPSVEFAWSVPAALPLGAPTNYNIYQGSSSLNYTNEMACGTNLVLTVTNITPGVTNFYNVTYQAQGMESMFGGEISYSPPAQPPGPLFKPIIILTAQAAPAVTGPWSNVCSVQLAAPGAAGFFRTQIASAP